VSVLRQGGLGISTLEKKEGKKGTKYTKVMRKLLSLGFSLGDYYYYYYIFLGVWLCGNDDPMPQI